MATFTKTHKYLASKVNPVAATDTVDWNDDTIKWMLVDSTTAPAAATHDYINDLSANEVTGANYTAGGTALTSKSITGTTTVNFDCADTVWAQNASGFTDARYALLYKDTGVEATSIIVGYIDLGSVVSTVTGPLTLQIAAGGLFDAT